MISFFTAFFLGVFVCLLVLYFCFYSKIKKLLQFKKDLDQLDNMFNITNGGVQDDKVSRI